MKLPLMSQQQGLGTCAAEHPGELGGWCAGSGRGLCPPSPAVSCLAVPELYPFNKLVNISKVFP